MSTGGPMRQKDSLADVVEMLLDKGIVVNADIIVTIGETELLGIHLRAAIASFETAAQYGLEFPDGTDTDRIQEVTGRRSQPESIRATGSEPDIVDENDETATWTVRPPVVVREDADTELATPEATAGESESDTADSSDDDDSESETDAQSTEESDGDD